MTIGRKALTGAAWLTVSNHARLIVSFITTVLLARLLEPAHFGTVALAYGLVELFSALAAWGLDAAIIHRQDTEAEKVVATILALRAGLAAGVFCLALLAYPLLRHLYEPMVCRLVLLLAFFRLTRMVFATYRTLLQRDLLLKRHGLLSLGADFLASAVAIGMAFSGAGLWSLVALQIMGHLLDSLGAWAWCPCRPRPKFDRATARWVFSFARRTLVSGILERILRETDRVIVGTLTTPRALGFYSKSLSLSTYLGQLFLPATYDTALPVFGRLQHDSGATSRTLELILALVIRLAVLVYVASALLAPEIIQLVLGAKWMGIVPLYRILVFHCILVTVLHVTIGFHLAIGRPEVVVQTRVAQIIFFVPVMILLVIYQGAAGAAMGVGLTTLLGCVLILRSMRTVARVRLLKVVLPPIVGAVVMLGGYFVLEHLAHLSAYLPRLLCVGALSSVLFLLTLLACEGRWILSVLRMWPQWIKSTRAISTTQ